MYFFLLKAIAGSIVGDASAEWFKKTKIGIWFYAKVERLYNWAAKRYDIKIATVEEKLLKKYPNMMNRINMLEQRIATLEEDDGRRNQN
jgi:Zn-dependent protease with chaperone function